MTIEELKRRKQEMGASNETIAEWSGVPLGTVQKVFGGKTRNPRRKTIMALERVLQGSSMMRETSASYEAESMATVADYYGMPPERRVELIDGVIYDLSAPTTKHQIITLRMAMQFADYLDKYDSSCEVLLAPVDVQLDCDDKTMVQPDLVVLCDGSKDMNRCIYGAPDYVAEVLSARSRKRDLTMKLAKYEAAGVREYWVVDPEQERVIVYDFAAEDVIRFYSFRDEIPVAISQGQLSIDFTEISRHIR